MALPEVTLSGNASVQAIVALGVGVDDSTIGRARATIAKKWTSGDLWSPGRSRQGASPLDAQTVIAEAGMFHGHASRTDRNAIIETQRAGKLKMALVTLVEWYDEGHVPALGGETKIANGIMSGIQGSGLDRQAEDFFASIESDETKNAIMAVAISHSDNYGQLAAMA